jgi:ribonuclease HI
MELMSVIAALESLTRPGLNIEVYSDSKYVVQAVMERWLDKWMATNFKGGKKNSDLWRKYHQLSRQHTIKFIWVKGHASNPYNQRCDELATAAADGGNLVEDTGYEG